jgi:hypothetical protein
VVSAEVAVVSNVESDVARRWPGLLQVPNEQPKVSKAMFVKGVLEYRVLVHEKGVSEVCFASLASRASRASLVSLASCGRMFGRMCCSS